MFLKLIALNLLTETQVSALWAAGAQASESSCAAFPAVSARSWSSRCSEVTLGSQVAAAPVTPPRRPGYRSSNTPAADFDSHPNHPAPLLENDEPLAQGSGASWRHFHMSVFSSVRHNPFPCLSSTIVSPWDSFGPVRLMLVRLFLSCSGA